MHALIEQQSAAEFWWRSGIIHSGTAGFGSDGQQEATAQASLHGPTWVGTMTLRNGQSTPTPRPGICWLSCTALVSSDRPTVWRFCAFDLCCCDLAVELACALRMLPGTHTAVSTVDPAMFHLPAPGRTVVWSHDES